jgi:hypothetical protein
MQKLYPMSDAKAQRVLLGLRAGLTLRLVGERPQRFKDYCDSHPEFALEARPLEAANARTAYLRKGAWIREKTHCVNGHSFAEHARVAVHKGWVTRQCRACQRLRYLRGGAISPETLAKVTERIKRGAPLTSCTKPGPGYLVWWPALAKARRDNPAFGEFVAAAIAGSNARGQLRRYQRERNAQKREDANDYHKILAMLPAGFPHKDDVVSAIFEDFLTKKLKRDDVRARVASYITAYNRTYPTKFAKFGDSPLVSLDEVMFEDGSTTRGDTVSRTLWD